MGRRSRRDSFRPLYPSQERKELRRLFNRMAATPGSLEQFMLHAGVRAETLEAVGGDARQALLAHYEDPERRRYNMSAVAADLANWQPAVAALASITSHLAHKVSK